MILMTLLAVGVALGGDDDLPDHRPLPEYLDQQAVEPVLRQSLAPLAACFPSAPPTALLVELDIASDGRVSAAGLVLDPEDPSRNTCSLAAICDLSFPTHANPQHRWSFRASMSGGEAWMMPGLTTIEPPRLPLFMLLPEPEQPALRSQLQQALGAEVYPLRSLEPLPICAHSAATPSP